MSTKSTIAYSNKYHLYEELLEENHENVYLVKYVGDDSIKVSIPWEACVALSEHVQTVLQNEKNMRDPDWLKAKLLLAEQELSTYPKDGVLACIVQFQIDDLREKLDALGE